MLPQNALPASPETTESGFRRMPAVKREESLSPVNQRGLFIGQGLCAGDGQGTGADVAGYAEGETIHIDRISRKPGFDFQLPGLGFLVGASVGRVEVDGLIPEPLPHIPLNRVRCRCCCLSRLLLFP